MKPLRNWLFWKLIEGHTVNAAEALLFTCEDELRLARESFRPYRPKKEVVVGLGVGAIPVTSVGMEETFRLTCPGLSPDRPYLLFLGRIDFKKGVDLLLKAYGQWVISVRDAAVVPDLVIAGPGMETDYGRRVLALALARTVQHQLEAAFSAAGRNAPRIHFPGMLRGDAKWGAFHGAAAFVLPSHQENFGIAVVEALGCGVPVLISDKVNIWREIVSAGAGFTAPDTVEGTLQNLRSWSASPQRGAELSAAAIRCARSVFSTERLTDRFLRALE